MSAPLSIAFIGTGVMGRSLAGHLQKAGHSLHVFNRTKDTSAVLKQIPDLAKAHANFKREVAGFKHESGFRFVLHHRDDKNRELTLTVLVFDVPS